MRAYVGVTDWDWYQFLRARGATEVNFWQPSGGRRFAAIPWGAPFLFQIHYSHGNRIVEPNAADEGQAPSSIPNVLYEGVVGMRHPDHRFEWTRQEFAVWSERIAAAYGYRVCWDGNGDLDEQRSVPTQLAVFTQVERS